MYDRPPSPRVRSVWGVFKLCLRSAWEVAIRVSCLCVQASPALDRHWAPELNCCQPKLCDGLVLCMIRSHEYQPPEWLTGDHLDLSLVPSICQGHAWLSWPTYWTVCEGHAEICKPPRCTPHSGRLFAHKELMHALDLPNCQLP